MDLAFSQEYETFRTQVREFLKKPPEIAPHLLLPEEKPMKKGSFGNNY
ncbi:MAG: hypothetical protein CM1200mP24_09250 [Gammaproteobacteria bacterium]|nr:MAG: hypothetical protein CM1200mP24_09250 [Gammaproteobacteria bacterium]